MHVVQLVMSRQFRGAEIFASQLSSELQLNGIEVTYLALYKSPDKTFTPSVPYIDLGISRGGVLNLKAVRELAAALKRINPDIVQANAGDTLKYAILAKFFYRLKFKIIFRNASTISKYLTSSVQRRLYQTLFRNVDYVCSVSNVSKLDLLKVFPSCANKIEVIPNGVQLRKYTSTDSYDANSYNIVHVGGFTFEKNHEALVRILSNVVRQRSDVKLYLIGEGPLKSQVETIVKSGPLAKSVIFLGAQSNVLDYLAAADVLVLPSRIEGMPAVILEAMYCKVPVVAFNVGGISELVKDGETGWLIPANDETAFTEKLLQLIGTPTTEHILANAYNLVTSHYDNSKIATQFIEVYRTLMKP